MVFGETEELLEIKKSIIKDFLNGKSIRQISKENPKFGRTAINNIITEFANKSKENLSIVNERKLINKTHKTSTELEKYSVSELDEETIQKLYRKIMNNQLSLTEAASLIGRSRDYLKSRIIEYINNDEETKEFKRVLRNNQNSTREDEYKEYMTLDLEKRKEIIFKRLSDRVSSSQRTMYRTDVLELKFQRLKKYLLVKRNEKIKNDNDKLTEDDFYTMLFDTPLLLSMSLGNKIRPAIENLDNNPNIGYARANHIISNDASVIGSSIMRTNLQIKMLVDFGHLETFLKKPRNFRNSPEMLYALMKYYEETSKENQPNENYGIFLSRSQLKNKYGTTPELIKEEFNVREKYGDDEYFDSSR